MKMKLINKDTKVVVQGLTGTQGKFHAARMKEYGTKVVAGVTPGRGGQEVDGTPVYDTVIEAKERHGCDASIIFVPAGSALDAALEAMEAGMDPVVVITEGIPVRDTIEFVARAKQLGTTVVGPNTPGLIKAGESKMGIMPNQGGSSGFTFGETVGFLKGVLAALGIPLVAEPTPQAWKKAVGIPMNPPKLQRNGVRLLAKDATAEEKANHRKALAAYKVGQKSLSRDRARQLFPQLADQLSQRNHADRAEALLLAWYCRQTMKGATE